MNVNHCDLRLAVTQHSFERKISVSIKFVPLLMLGNRYSYPDAYVDLDLLQILVYREINTDLNLSLDFQSYQLYSFYLRMYSQQVDLIRIV